MRHSLPGRNTILRFPLLHISARPVCIASTVIYFNSDTLIPVVQIVCIINDNRSFSFCSAARTRRAYSIRFSSLSSLQNIAFCILKSLTASSSHPIKRRNPLITVNIELTVVAAYFSESVFFHSISLTFVNGSPFKQVYNVINSCVYFCIVALLLSCSCK